jgi:two-component system, sensor histidine kinase and response regulator
MLLKTGRLTALFPLLFLVCSAEPVRIGVLAHRGREQCLRQWSATADYLSKTLAPNTFQIVPLDFEEIFTAAEHHEADFFLANSAIYTELAVRHDAARIATLNNLGPNDITHAVFGGTVFFRQDQNSTPVWRDLRKKTVAAVDATSFGGWLTARREIAEAGLMPGEGFKLEFLGTHDAVVYAVRDRQADAGVVRTGTLEQMALEGKIQLDDFSTIPCPGLDYCADFGFRHSTRLYPEWPMAKADRTSIELARQVAIALMQMPKPSVAARRAGCAGWMFPLSYQLVEECLKELNARPFEDYGKVTLMEAVIQHWPYVTAIFLLLILVLIAMAITLRLNRQVHEARQAAVDAAQAKSSFLANMSHEIRTPMNAVIGMTDLLMETNLDPEQKEFANIVRVSGESLLSLISDVLDYSKIEAGHMALEQQDFDLAGCVEDALDLIVSKTAEKGIELTYEFDSNVPAVIRGDASRLRQILLNLLSNAAKFTTQGEIRVAVSAKQSEADFKIHFAVHDTGIGIDQGKIDHIFHAFTQADSSTTRQYGGTGLGLSISRRLSEIMGGRMWAESRPGQGSTFHFTIHAPATNRNKTIRAEQRAFDIKTRAVLIVDDNETNLKILSAQLTRWGLRPVALRKPQAALESILKGDEYALLITDMQMPGMDGAMLVKEVRKTRSPAQLPIIMLTSIGQDKPDKTLRLDSYLNKPVKPAQLHQNITNILHGDGGNYTAVDKTIHPPFAGGTLRLLVVEDNKVNQTVALRMLQKLGFSADLAGDGQEALTKTEQTEYDLILMDIQMPGMNGLEATLAIREKYKEQKQRPLIIGMTAHAANEERERGLAAGMDDYLTKPIQLVKLKEVLWHVQETKGSDV